MSKVCIAFAAAMVLALGMTACKGKTSIGNQGGNVPPVQQGASQLAVGYTCPMHSQISESKPGKCPICGMDLVQKK